MNSNLDSLAIPAVLAIAFGFAIILRSNFQFGFFANLGDFGNLFHTLP